MFVRVHIHNSNTHNRKELTTMKSIATRLLVFSFAVLCVFSWTFSAVAVDITEQTTPTLDIITQINPDFELDAATVTE